MDNYLFFIVVLSVFSIILSLTVYIDNHNVLNDYKNNSSRNQPEVTKTRNVIVKGLVDTTVGNEESLNKGEVMFSSIQTALEQGYKKIRIKTDITEDNFTFTNQDTLNDTYYIHIDQGVTWTINNRVLFKNCNLILQGNDRTSTIKYHIEEAMTNGIGVITLDLNRYLTVNKLKLHNISEIANSQFCNTTAHQTYNIVTIMAPNVSYCFIGDSSNTESLSIKLNDVYIYSGGTSCHHMINYYGSSSFVISNLYLYDVSSTSDTFYIQNTKSSTITNVFQGNTTATYIFNLASKAIMSNFNGNNIDIKSSSFIQLSHSNVGDITAQSSSEIFLENCYIYGNVTTASDAKLYALNSHFANSATSFSSASTFSIFNNCTFDCTFTSAELSTLYINECVFNQDTTSLYICGKDSILLGNKVTNARDVYIEGNFCVVSKSYFQGGTTVTNLYLTNTNNSHVHGCFVGSLTIDGDITTTNSDVSLLPNVFTLNVATSLTGTYDTPTGSWNRGWDFGAI